MILQQQKENLKNCLLIIHSYVYISANFWVVIWLLNVYLSKEATLFFFMYL